jgi:hypothetical protein
MMLYSPQMKTGSLDPLDEDEVVTLNKLLDNADINEDERMQLFSLLGLNADDDKQSGGLLQRYTKVLRIKYSVFSSATIFLFGIIAVLVYTWGYYFEYYRDPTKAPTAPVIAAAHFSTFIFTALAFLVGYFRWDKTEKNRNVDDGMRRKELANKMIFDNTTILRPYVANVFDIDERYADTILNNDDRIKVQMFIFTEIDNLEYVFDKSRAGVIQKEFVLRAIKIFVARAENNGFGRLARDLVCYGRYNRSFVRCAESLLDLGYFRSQRTGRPSSVS